MTTILFRLTTIDSLYSYHPAPGGVVEGQQLRNVGGFSFALVMLLLLTTVITFMGQNCRRRPTRGKIDSSHGRLKVAVPQVIGVHAMLSLARPMLFFIPFISFDPNHTCQKTNDGINTPSIWYSNKCVLCVDMRRMLYSTADRRRRRFATKMAHSPMFLAGDLGRAPCVQCPVPAYWRSRKRCRLGRARRAPPFGIFVAGVGSTRRTSVSKTKDGRWGGDNHVQEQNQLILARMHLYAKSCTLLSSIKQVTRAIKCENVTCRIPWVYL